MKKPTLIALALSALLAACAQVPNAPPADSTAFTLWSPAFADGARLEQRHAGNLASNPNCVGSNVAPPLAWRNVPAGTRSLVMLVHDQEGRSGLGVVHWIAYGIVPEVTGFADNEISAPSNKYQPGKSTLGLGHYMGPCPPVNTGHHHYVYTLIATDLEAGALPAGLTWEQVAQRLAGHAKGASSIVLRYGRP